MVLLATLPLKIHVSITLVFTELVLHSREDFNVYVMMDSVVPTVKMERITVSATSVLLEPNVSMNKTLTSVTAHQDELDNTARNWIAQLFREFAIMEFVSTIHYPRSLSNANAIRDMKESSVTQIKTNVPQGTCV